MEKINLHNYEAYFLDFAEGNLSDAQIQQMEEFLNLHPELRTELEDFEPISISDINNENLGWNDLKKPTFHELENDKELRDAFFIRAIENLLTSYEKKILDDRSLFTSSLKTT